MPMNDIQTKELSRILRSVLVAVRRKQKPRIPWKKMIKAGVAKNEHCNTFAFPPSVRDTQDRNCSIDGYLMSKPVACTPCFIQMVPTLHTNVSMLANRTRSATNSAMMGELLERRYYANLSGMRIGPRNKYLRSLNIDSSCVSKGVPIVTWDYYGDELTRDTEYVVIAEGGFLCALHVDTRAKASRRNLPWGKDEDAYLYVTLVCSTNGKGYWLMQSAEALACQLGIKRMVLSALPNAIPFYLKDSIGFRFVNRNLQYVDRLPPSLSESVRKAGA